MNPALFYWFRWMVLLPASVVALFAAHILNNFTMTYFIPMPQFLRALSLAWFDLVGFLMAGYYIAPSRKNIATTILAALYMVLNIHMIAHVYKTEPADFWTRMLAGAIGIAGCTAVIAALAKDGYKDKADFSDDTFGSEQELELNDETVRK